MLSINFTIAAFSTSPPVADHAVQDHCCNHLSARVRYPQGGYDDLRSSCCNNNSSTGSMRPARLRWMQARRHGKRLISWPVPEPNHSVTLDAESPRSPSAVRIILWFHHHPDGSCASYMAGFLSGFPFHLYQQYHSFAKLQSVLHTAKLSGFMTEWTTARVLCL